MSIREFNDFMTRCKNTFGVRYVTPTIHPGFGTIVAVTLHTHNTSVEFTTTNNHDKNFDLYAELIKYLDEMGCA